MDKLKLSIERPNIEKTGGSLPPALSFQSLLRLRLHDGVAEKTQRLVFRRQIFVVA